MDTGERPEVGQTAMKIFEGDSPEIVRSDDVTLRGHCITQLFAILMDV